MQAHPIMDSSRRWISVLLLVAAAIGIYTGLLMTYAGARFMAGIDRWYGFCRTVLRFGIFVMVCYRHCIVGTDGDCRIGIGHTVLAGRPGLLCGSGLSL